MRKTINLNEEETKKLEALKKEMGFKSYSAAFKGLLMNKKLKQNLPSKINAMYHLTVGILNQCQHLANNASSTDDIIEGLDELNKEIETAKKIVNKFKII